MRSLLAILWAILNSALAVWLAPRQDAAQDAMSPPRALVDRLRRRIRQSWGPPAVAVMLLVMTGCATTTTRTVYVPDGTPVRLRETVPQVRVWVLDQAGQPVPGQMDLPEGWYCLPDSGDE